VFNTLICDAGSEMHFIRQSFYISGKGEFAIANVFIMDQQAPTHTHQKSAKPLGLQANARTLTGFSPMINRRGGVGPADLNSMEDRTKKCCDRQKKSACNFRKENEARETNHMIPGRIQGR